jgi:hypothetical protein
VTYQNEEFKWADTENLFKETVDFYANDDYDFLIGFNATLPQHLGNFVAEMA